MLVQEDHDHVYALGLGERVNKIELQAGPFLRMACKKVARVNKRAGLLLGKADRGN